MEMIQVAKKMEKEAIKSSRFDFIRLGFALFFMVAVLSAASNFMIRGIML